MALEIAIIADDLTGALDAAAPLVARGLAVAVAVSPAHLPAALALGLPGVAVSTASRALAAPDAAARVQAAAEMLAAGRSRFAFKKVDSRLKGHPGPESQAMLRGLGLRRALVAPAVPALGRVVRAGCVEGTGIAEPIAVRARLAGLEAPLAIPDTPDQTALEAVAAGLPPETLAVGAAGLSAALARRLQRPFPVAHYLAEPPMLLAIGSRDPIALAQVAHLRAARADIACVDAPDGTPAGEGMLYCCTEGGGGLAERAVAARFAAALARRVRALRPRTLLACGGDTAAALAEALGAGVLLPQGEVLPGMPFSRMEVPGLGAITLVSKSGGFGAADALLAACPAAPP